MDYLPHTAESYFEGLKYYRKAVQEAKNERGNRLASLAVEALRYAAMRKENRWLTYNHLKEMHGQPVYIAGEAGGGIVDARRQAIIMLDGDGLKYHSWGWETVGTRLRFPGNDVDLLNFGEQKQ